MPSLPDYLEYLSACKVILCKTHGHCLRQPQVGPHLDSMHNITSNDRNAVFQAMSDLEIAVKMTDVYLPVAGSAPIKGLPIFEGFECCATKECPYLNIYPENLKRHLNKYHKGIEDFKKKFEYHNKVMLQNFFPYSGNSGLAGYFIVNPESSMRDFPQVSVMAWERSARPSLSKKSRVEVIDLEEEEASEGEELGSRDTQNPNSTPPPRWLRNTNPQVNHVISRKSFYSTSPTTPAKRKTQQDSPLGTSKKIPSQGLPSKTLKFTDSSFAEMIFYTKRRDQDIMHICLATDLMPTNSALPVNPENLDFDLYCGILRNKEILDNSYQLEFTDLKGRRAQITDQMTFRAAILVQVSQNVDMITFHAKPIAQVVRVPAAPTTPSAAPVQTHPIDISPLVTSFAHTVFCTESLDTGKLHVCLGNDFTSLTTPSSSNAVINLTSDTADYERYCSLLRKEKMLDDDQALGFNDANGRRVPIINQMMFRAAVIYQVSRKADMISFTSSRTTSREGGERERTGAGMVG